MIIETERRLAAYIGISMVRSVVREEKSGEPITQRQKVKVDGALRRALYAGLSFEEAAAALVGRDVREVLPELRPLGWKFEQK